MKKVFLYSAVLTTALAALGGATAAFAAPTTYPDGQTAISDGKVKFVGSDGKTDIPDPLDPEVPVTPVDPVNPSEDPLRIAYVSPFNFNQRSWSASIDKVAFAESVTVKSVFQNSAGTIGKTLPKDIYGDLDATSERETVPFVTTLDSRTQRGGGWNLGVKHSPFKLAKNDKIELKGAEIYLLNNQYVQGNQVANTLPTLVPNAAKDLTPVKLDSNGAGDLASYRKFVDDLKGTYKISTGDNTLLSSAADTNNQGVGAYSLAFGKNLSNDKNELSKAMITANATPAEFKATDGVALRVPAKTATELSMLNEEKTKTESDPDLFYHTQLTWTLAPGVSAKP